MTTTLRHELVYDAPLSQVFAMLADPAFRERVIAAQRGEGSATVEATDDATTVVIDQHLAVRRVPSYATKFVGDRINIVQREEWTSDHVADLHVSIPGKPGHVEGTMTLTETDGRTVQRIEAEVSVRIPLVGGKIEPLIAEVLVKALSAEEQVGRDYLSA